MDKGYHHEHVLTNLLNLLRMLWGEKVHCVSRVDPASCLFPVSPRSLPPGNSPCFMATTVFDTHRTRITFVSWRCKECDWSNISFNAYFKIPYFHALCREIFKEKKQKQKKICNNVKICSFLLLSSHANNNDNFPNVDTKKCIICDKLILQQTSVCWGSWPLDALGSKVDFLLDSSVLWILLIFITCMKMCHFMCVFLHFPVLQVKSFSTTYYADVMIQIIDEDDWMIKYSWSEWHRHILHSIYQGLLCILYLIDGWLLLFQ